MTDPHQRPRRRPVLRGAAIGYGVIFALYTIMLLTGELTPASSPVVTLLTLLTAPFFAGALPGMLIGGVVHGVRVLSERNRPPLPAPAAPPPIPQALQLNDAWSRLLIACVEPVRRCDLALAELPPSPARDWLTQIVATMRDELPTARNLAETGRRLHPPRQPGLTEHPLYLRLRTAADEFAATERRIGELIAQLVAQPDLKQVDNQLQLLEQQLPHLRQPD